MNTTPTKSKSLIFHTDTSIDPRSWQIMGLTSKNDEDHIGRFGTGLKYAIAIVLRLGGKITIKDNTTDSFYLFETSTQDFRGRDFDVITCNGISLPFTTDYGKDWAPWQAYRELESNTIDEEGMSFFGEPPETGTVITINCEKIEEVARNRHRYFLDESEDPIETLVISKKPVGVFSYTTGIFLKGVLVFQSPKLKYAYNFSSIELTEDRTLRFQYLTMSDLTTAWLKSSEKPLVENLLRDDALEINGSVSGILPANCSVEFLSVLSELHSQNHKLPNDLAILAQKVTRGDDAISWTPTNEQLRKVSKITGFLNISLDIRYKNPFNKSVLAYYDPNNKTVILSEKIFEDDEILIGGILEEYLHSLGYDDFTRSFQTELIRRFGKLTLTTGIFNE